MAYILMGDVIDSGKNDSVKLMTCFKSVINGVKKKVNEQYLSPLTITLGDEFQSIPKDLYVATKTIIAIEEEIIRKGYDFKLRYIINEGTIDTKINTLVAYEMLGKGLTDARQELNNLKKGTKDKRIKIILKNEIMSQLLNNQFYILISIIDDWKIKDYDLVNSFIKFMDYIDVATVLKKDKSLMWRREKTLQVRQYFAAKQSIELLTKK